MIGGVDAFLDVAAALHDQPHLSYQPGPTLAAFIENRHRRSLARCPSQVGKTVAGAARSVKFSAGDLGVPAPNILAVLVADLQNVYGEFCEKVAQVLDPGLLDPRCRFIPGEGYRVGSMRAVKFRNGSRWLFRTSEGASIAVASFTADGGWVDEIPKRQHYFEFSRGLASKSAPLWVTFTPIGRPVEWFRDRVEGDEEYRLTNGVSGKPPEEHWQQYVASLTTTECPWRSQENIDRQIASTDVFERPQRVYAEWEGPTIDRRLTGFSDLCVIDEIPKMEHPQVGVWIDHGENAGREHALLAIIGPDAIYIVDEYVNPTHTDVVADAHGILGMLDYHKIVWSEVDSWVGDVNSAGKMSVAGRSVNEELALAIGAELGMRPGAAPIRIERPSKGSDSVERNLRVVNGGFLRSRLYVHARCKGLIKACRHFDGSEDLKHPIDALAYGAVPILLGWDRARCSHLVLTRR